MEVNYTNLRWNDYSTTNNAILGYFIEFGGNGQAYSVEWDGQTANYPVNAAYYTPKVYTDNDQWHQFSPGNRVSTETTFKPNVMRSNVLILGE